MKAKRVFVFAMAFCMVLWMMPSGAFAVEETDCICSVACKETKVNEECEVCMEDFEQCAQLQTDDISDDDDIETQDDESSDDTTKDSETTTQKATTTTKKVVTTTQKTTATTKATDKTTQKAKTTMKTTVKTTKSAAKTTATTKSKAKTTVTTKSAAKSTAKTTAKTTKEDNTTSKAKARMMMSAMLGDGDNVAAVSTVITMDSTTLDFGEKCVNIQPKAKEFSYTNELGKTVEFEVESTSSPSNYSIKYMVDDEGKSKVDELKDGSKVTVQISPKENLKADTYKEQFNIKIDGEKVEIQEKGETSTEETFTAIFKVVEHEKESDTWSYDDSEHWHICKYCGEKIDKASHVKGTCSSDDDGHWYTCEDCGAKFGEESHIAGDTYSSDDTSHWNVCTVCGEKFDKESHIAGDTLSYDDNDHWYVCTKCKAKFDKESHVKEDTYSSDDTSHWYACTECGVELEKAEHTVKTAANCVDKAVCKVCENSYGSVDASNHKSLSNKVEAKAATHTTEGNIAYYYCGACKKYFKDNNGKAGDEIKAADTVIAKITTHTASETWSSDEKTHWKVCTVGGEKLSEAEHTFSWKVDQQPTSSANGSGHYECSVCGYKKASVPIYATGTTATTTATTAATTAATTRSGLLSKIIPTTGDNSHIILWFSVLVICAMAFLGVLGRRFGKRR